MTHPELNDAEADKVIKNLVSIAYSHKHFGPVMSDAIATIQRLALAKPPALKFVRYCGTKFGIVAHGAALLNTDHEIPTPTAREAHLMKLLTMEREAIDTLEKANKECEEALSRRAQEVQGLMRERDRLLAENTHLHNCLEESTLPAGMASTKPEPEGFVTQYTGHYTLPNGYYAPIKAGDRIEHRDGDIYINEVQVFQAPRAKVEAPKVDWSVLPPWAKWVAQNDNLIWYYFASPPAHNNYEWKPDCSFSGKIPAQYWPTFQGAWRDSLTERPV